MEEKQKAAYIAAFIDGEGHIGCHLTKRGHWSRSIGACNTDKALIDFLAQSLHDLGFQTRITFSDRYKPDWNDRWTLYISGGRPAFILFSKIIPIQSPAKKSSLAKILSTYEEQDQLRNRQKLKSSLPCEICGKLVRVCPSFRKRGCGRFCSKTCRGISQRNRIEISCETCGKKYEVIIAREKTSKFCSASCFGKSQSERVASMAKIAANARWHKQ